MLLTKIKKIITALHPRNLKEISLVTTVTFAVITGVLSAGILAGYYAKSIIYQNKLIDTWAIMYLESEVIAQKISRTLAQNAKMVGAEVSLRWDAKSQEFTSDNAPDEIKATTQDLGLSQIQDLEGSNPNNSRVLEIAGSYYLFKEFDSSSQKLKLIPLSPSVFETSSKAKSSLSAKTYMLTREGRLVRTSSDEITSTNFMSRPLVQEFVKSPITGSLFEFSDKAGEEMFGFFMEIPSTNLVAFAEAPKAQILSSLQEIIKKYAIALLVIMCLVLIVVALPLAKVTTPLLRLAQMAQYVGQGNFSLRTPVTGLGEVRSLGQAMNHMLEGLEKRDHEISTLLVEKTQKIRLEAELRIAQGIQANLLPQASEQTLPKLEIAATYVPATECAGDWYHFHYNEAADESIIVIGDVSGHGAGSSMFTALIAGVYDQFRFEVKSSWNLISFMTQMNRVLRRFGKGAWHATMLVIKIRHQSGDVEVVSAGHTPALLYNAQANPDGSGFSWRRLLVKGEVLGLSDSPKLGIATYPFKQGDSIALYTDGLVETKSDANRSVATKALLRSIEPCRGKSAQTTLNKLLSDWRVHKGQRAADDDVCVVVVRAA